MGVFSKAPQGDGTWLYTDLHDFTPRSDDGRWPVGSVFIDANGNLFGTASGGGDRSYCETAAWQHRRHATLTARNRWWHPWNRWPDTSSTRDPSRERRFRRLAKTCLSA